MESLIYFINSICEWADKMINGIVVADGQDVTLLSIMNYHFPESYNNMLKLLENKIDYDAVFGVVEGLGILFLLIFYSIDLMSKASSIGFTFETFMYSLVKFVAGCALIFYAGDICDGIIKFGDAVAGTITSSTSATIDFGLNRVKLKLLYLQSPEQQLSSLNMVNTTIYCFMQVILTFVLNITAIGLAYFRAIKLVLYKIFMPVMVADVFGSGLSGAVLRHVKKYLGIIMEYPLCCIIAVLTTAIFDSVSMEGNGMSYMGSLVMVVWAVFKVTKSISTEAEEIFGSR